MFGAGMCQPLLCPDEAFRGGDIAALYLDMLIEQPEDALDHYKLSLGRSLLIGCLPGSRARMDLTIARAHGLGHGDKEVCCLLFDRHELGVCRALLVPGARHKLFE